LAKTRAPIVLDKFDDIFNSTDNKMDVVSADADNRTADGMNVDNSDVNFKSSIVANGISGIVSNDNDTDIANNDDTDIIGTITYINNPHGERILEIPLDDLYPPEYHPFQVNDDEAMDRLTKNIKRNGVREPGLARPRIDDTGTFTGYELVVGNRRKRACQLAERLTMPVIIREMSDEDAVIAMVDSNLEQREKLLYSEKAWAYRVKLEALNHNGIKGDKLSVEILVEQTGESKNTIFRIVRLTELVIDLLDRVDHGKLSFTAAVELSYLSQSEQMAASAAMDNYDIKPSHSQAVKLKKMKQADELTLELIDEVLSEAKKEPREIKEVSQFREYFPSGYTVSQMSEVIAGLLMEWQYVNGVAGIAGIADITNITNATDTAAGLAVTTGADEVRVDEIAIDVDIVDNEDVVNAISDTAKAEDADFIAADAAKVVIPNADALQIAREEVLS